MSKAKTTKQFITEAKNAHGLLYSYTPTVYTNALTKIKFVCPTHGVQLQFPGDHIRSGCGLCGQENKQMPPKPGANCPKKQMQLPQVYALAVVALKSVTEQMSPEIAKDFNEAAWILRGLLPPMEDQNTEMVLELAKQLQRRNNGD